MNAAQSLPTDELFQVERRIARRADELTRRHGKDSADALEFWRQAEAEFWQDRAKVVPHAGAGTEATCASAM